MGCKNVPDIHASTAEDNPFAGPKLQPVGKVPVNMPLDWLCKKMDWLRVSLVDGYPSHISEAGDQLKGQFIKPARLQANWYLLHTDKEKASSWYSEASKLKSSYGQIAKVSGIFSTPPASSQISQETLRNGEKSARESTYICNQAAGFNQCLNKVQESMQKQLRVIQSDQSKGKSAS